MDYEKEFNHVKDYHTDEVMDRLKDEYVDDVWDIIEEYLQNMKSGEELIEEIRNLILCSVEHVTDKHDSHEDVDEGDIYEKYYMDN